MRINLAGVDFSGRRVLAECGEFRAETFTYGERDGSRPSRGGVAALRVANSRGSFTILPWMGQMVWRCDFDGRELAMRSIHPEPFDCRRSYDESYGCFLMHCGLTAMGNPAAGDDHPPHGELPIIRYDEGWLEFGEDANGPFAAVGGTARHLLCFACNYAFSPRVVLRAGAATLEITAEIENRKDIPLEYYYLLHINHRPVDGSRIVEPPLARAPIINHEVPPDYYGPWAEATNRFLDALDRDHTLQSVVGAKDESYRPEIVNCYFHEADAEGWAEVRQEFPEGGGVFVRYRPSELPYATRWIARTVDEDALGMCLPATAEHKGRAYCRAHGQQRFLPPGGRVAFHVATGLA